MKDDVRGETTPAASTGAYSWYVLAVLICCYGVYNLDKSVISVVLEPLKRQFALSDSVLGLLTGLAATLPFAVTCIPVGLLADRVNRTRLLVLLIVIWSLMTGFAGFAQSAAFLFISRIGVGAAEAGFSPVSMSLLSDYFPRRRRATALGTFGLGAPLGIIFGLGIGGYVVAAWGWRAAFFIAGLPGLLFATLLALTVREPVRMVDDARAPAQPGLSPLVRLFRREPALRHLVVGQLLCTTPIAAVAVWLPSFFVRVHGLNIHSAGPLSALVFGVFGSFGATITSIIADRVGRRHESRKLSVPIVGGVVGMSCGLLGVLWAPTASLAVLTLGPCAFCAQSIIGPGYSLIATLAPAALRSATLAVLLVAINVLSYGVGAQVVGIVSDHYAHTDPAHSLAYGLAVTFIFSAWGILHVWRAMSLLRRQEGSDGLIVASPVPAVQ